MIILKVQVFTISKREENNMNHKQESHSTT